MKTVNRSILSLVLLIALLAISTSVVHAKELGMLTISGPGIQGEVTLNDHETMLDLEEAGLFDMAILSKMPKDLGEGYNITAHLNLDGKLVPYIMMVYYPTDEGQAGYVHYTGRLEGETLKPIDEWHLLNRDADGVLRDLMAANNIAVQSALLAAPAAVEPAQEPVAAPGLEPIAAPVAQVPASGMVIAIVTAILALTGVALTLRRRTTSQPTA